jgi:hypothetical protein
MRRHAAWILLLMLTACGAPPPPATTVQGRCEQQTDQDPAVKAVLAQAPARSGEPRWQEELAVARRKSVTDCLAAAGIKQRGGVQPISRAQYGLGWY